jgi:fluoroquinolone transport system permease protein
LDEFSINIPLETLEDILIALLFLAMIPSFLGAIAGLIMIDDKDSGVLYGFSVSPVSIWKFLFIKFSIPIFIGILLSIITLAIVYSDFLVNFVVVFFAIILFALEIPIFALLFGTFSKDKIQALSLMKVMNIVYIIPILGYFLPTNLHFLTSISPPFWPLMLFWRGSTGLSEFVIYFLGGLIVHFGILLWLKKKFYTKLFL